MSKVILTLTTFALISAVTPGPLLTLIITETLEYGKANGIKIALAPLLTDLPIMLLSIFVLSKLAGLDVLLGAISLGGAIYLGYLGYQNIRMKQVNLKKESATHSLLKGVIANFLNPNPYIFYFSVLGPLLVEPMKRNFFYGPLAVLFFLGLFVAGMIVIVLLVNRIRGLFTSKKYLYAIRFLGFVLIIFAINFLREGLRLVGVF